MNKVVALLQVILAIVLGILALATLVNAILISTRPETISVVNAIIGLGPVSYTHLTMPTTPYV